MPQADFLTAISLVQAVGAVLDPVAGGHTESVHRAEELSRARWGEGAIRVCHRENTRRCSPCEPHCTPCTHAVDMVRVESMSSLTHAAHMQVCMSVYTL